MVSPVSFAKQSFWTVQPVSRLRLSAAQTRHYPRCVCNVIFRSHRHELTNTTHDMNQKRSPFYSVVFMSKTIMFRKRYHELKMGHFGEIRLADPVFSAVVLPRITQTHTKIWRTGPHTHAKCAKSIRWAGRISEGAEGLLHVVVGGADGGNHGRLGVAPQTLLQPVSYTHLTLPTTLYV